MKVLTELQGLDRVCLYMSLLEELAIGIGLSHPSNDLSKRMRLASWRVDEQLSVFFEPRTNSVEQREERQRVSAWSMDEDQIHGFLRRPLERIGAVKAQFLGLMTLCILNLSRAGVDSECHVSAKSMVECFAPLSASAVDL
jgi:hypothetical protein